MIQVFQPQMGNEEVEAVRAVMESNWIGRGPKVQELRQAWADRLGVSEDHIIPTTCATEGLFQIADDLGIGPWDDVVMPTIHFIGAANAVLSTGSDVFFCDVDKRTLMPTWDMIEEKITPQTAAVFILHYGGMAMPDYQRIVDECRQREIALVEDCAVAPETRYNGRLVGTLGDFAVWSFDAMKIISGGDGGLIYAKSDARAKRIERRTNLGLTVESGISSNASQWWSFGVTGPFRRALMNDITAAIILEQLKKLPRFMGHRALLWRAYLDRLMVTPGIDLPPTIPSNATHSLYTFWIQTKNRDDLAEHLRDNGVYTTFRYYPLHQVFGQSHCPNADYAAATTLNLPLHPGLSSFDIDKICRHINEFMWDL